MALGSYAVKAIVSEPSSVSLAEWAIMGFIGKHRDYDRIDADTVEMS
jgi:hypothetical protein